MPTLRTIKVNRLANYVLDVDIDWIPDYDNLPVLYIKLKPSATILTNAPGFAPSKASGGFWWRTSDNGLVEFGMYDDNKKLWSSNATEASKHIGKDIVAFHCDVTNRSSNGKAYQETRQFYTDKVQIDQCIVKAKKNSSIEMYKNGDIWCPRMKHFGQWIYKIKNTRIFNEDFYRKRTVIAGLEKPPDCAR